MAPAPIAGVPLDGKRVLSTHKLAIGGAAWQMLGRLPAGHASAVWEFQNPTIRDPAGVVAEGSILLTLGRRLDGVLHGDLTVSAFAERSLLVRLSLQFDAFRPRRN
jgi:hypothetical protein